MKIILNSGPLLLFNHLLEGALKRRDRLVNLDDLNFELVRVESDASRSGEVNVTFFPSDAFLRFSAELVGGDFGLA